MLIDRNSLIAFYEGKLSGKFSQKRFDVFEYIAKNPNCTRQDMDEDQKFHQKINSVCGRVNELIKAGLVIEIKEEPRNRLKAVITEPTTIKGIVMPQGIGR